MTGSDAVVLPQPPMGVAVAAVTGPDPGPVVWELSAEDVRESAVATAGLVLMCCPSAARAWRTGAGIMKPWQAG